MRNEKVSDLSTVSTRDKAQEILFNTAWILEARQPQSPGQSAAMRVHRDALVNAARLAEYNVGGLATDAGKTHQTLQIPLHALGEPSRRSHDVARLAAKEAERSDDERDVLGTRFSQLGRRRIPGKESGEDGVDLGVRALRGENNGNEQLKLIAVIQRTSGGGIGNVQPTQNVTAC